MDMQVKMVFDKHPQLFDRVGNFVVGQVYDGRNAFFRDVFDYLVKDVFLAAEIVLEICRFAFTGVGDVFHAGVVIAFLPKQIPGFF
jgi:hypothetical protein